MYPAHAPIKHTGVHGRVHFAVTQNVTVIIVTVYLNTSLLQKQSFCTEEIKVALEAHTWFSNGTKSLKLIRTMKPVKMEKL